MLSAAAREKERPRLARSVILISLERRGNALVLAQSSARVADAGSRRSELTLRHLKRGFVIKGAAVYDARRGRAALCEWLYHCC